MRTLPRQTIALIVGWTLFVIVVALVTFSPQRVAARQAAPTYEYKALPPGYYNSTSVDTTLIEVNQRDTPMGWEVWNVQPSSQGFWLFLRRPRP